MEIETFDMQERGSYNKLRENNISVNLLNIVGPEACPKAKEYIQEEGTSLVLCDGGNKVWEFEVLAPLLKSGDFIMAHDYVEDWDRDYEHFFDKIWNWAEVEEKHIAECCQQNNLKPYMQEQFREAAWACRRKEQ